jgi:hypothetical protein
MRRFRNKQKYLSYDFPGPGMVFVPKIAQDTMSKTFLNFKKDYFAIVKELKYKYWAAKYEQRTSFIEECRRTYEGKKPRPTKTLEEFTGNFLNRVEKSYLTKEELETKFFAELHLIGGGTPVLPDTEFDKTLFNETDVAMKTFVDNLCIHLRRYPLEVYQEMIAHLVNGGNATWKFMNMLKVVLEYYDLHNFIGDDILHKAIRETVRDYVVPYKFHEFNSNQELRRSFIYQLGRVASALKHEKHAASVIEVFKQKNL